MDCMAQEKVQWAWATACSPVVPCGTHLLYQFAIGVAKCIPAAKKTMVSATAARIFTSAWL